MFWFCPLMHTETVQKPGVLCRSPKRTAGPTLGDGMVPLERPVHDGRSHLRHQMGTPRRPAHLLLGVHPAVQQPLDRALSDRRRDRFVASAGCRVVDDDLGLSRYIRLKIAQKTRHLPRHRGKRRCVGGGYCSQSFVDEIESAPDLTMPETPSDSLDRLGKASTGLAITLRGVGPALRACPGITASKFRPSALFRLGYSQNFDSVVCGRSLRLLDAQGLSPKVACMLPAARRDSRYLLTDFLGRPRPDAAQGGRQA
jgi:hypothetical protein